MSELSKIALQKLMSYCAYQERCQYAVLKKLNTFELNEDEKAEIISLLINDNFLSEERFAMLYARSKYNIKAWGRLKIYSELKLLKVPKNLINKAISQIPDADYQKTFQKVASKKQKEIGKLTSVAKKAKLYNYLVSKGYENEMINSFILDEK